MSGVWVGVDYKNRHPKDKCFERNLLRFQILLTILGSMEHTIGGTYMIIQEEREYHLDSE